MAESAPLQIQGVLTLRRRSALWFSSRIARSRGVRGTL